MHTRLSVTMQAQLVDAINVAFVELDLLPNYTASLVKSAMTPRFAIALESARRSSSRPRMFRSPPGSRPRPRGVQKAWTSRLDQVGRVPPDWRRLIGSAALGSMRPPHRPSTRGEVHPSHACAQTRKLIDWIYNARYRLRTAHGLRLAKLLVVLAGL